MPGFTKCNNVLLTHLVTIFFLHFLYQELYFYCLIIKIMTVIIAIYISCGIVGDSFARVFLQKLRHLKCICSATRMCDKRDNVRKSSRGNLRVVKLNNFVSKIFTILSNLRIAFSYPTFWKQCSR